MLSEKHTGYDGYKLRANFYPAMSRTVDALTGTLMRRAPMVTGSTPELDAQLENIDLRGTSLAGLTTRVARELLITGRCAIALDASAGRVFWRFFRAEDAVTWFAPALNGVPTLRRAVFTETDMREAPGNRFLVEVLERARCYEFDTAGRVVCACYDATLQTALSTATLGLDGGSDLDFLPVVFINATGVDADPEKPPLLNLADANLAHYRASADFEHGLHWAALPTPWIAQKSALPEGVAIGSSTVWKLDENAKAGMLETSGAGLAERAADMQMKVQQMAALGARLIADSTKQAETAEAVRIKSGADSASLYSIADAVDDALTTLLRWHAQWGKIPAAPSVTVNRDFYDARLGPQDVAQLMALRQADLISPQTFYAQLRSGEWADTNRSYEDELALIETARAAAAPRPTPPEEE